MASQHLSSPAEDSARRNLLLLAARLDAGLTQAELAERCGVSRQAVNALEQGGQPRPRTAKAMADALGVRVSDVFPVDGRDAA